ncbi:anti-sigma factor family protein [Frateuria aurantia]
MTTRPSEHDLHAYVDGRLDGLQQQAVALYLAQHPELAAEVQDWQRDAQRLRAAAGPWQDLPPNPGLDPLRLRAGRRQRQRARWAIAAMLVLGLGLGGLGGWQMHGWQLTRASPPMSDALTAYRLATQDQGLQLDIVSEQAPALQQWLDAHVRHSIRLPDLRDSGFHPVGGRLFITDKDVAAMVLYEDARHHTISFYVRPPGLLRNRLPYGLRADGELLAQYGSDRLHNFALVSRDDRTDRQAAARALKSLI